MTTKEFLDRYDKKEPAAAPKLHWIHRSKEY